MILGLLGATQKLFLDDDPEIARGLARMIESIGAVAHPIKDAG